MQSSLICFCSSIMIYIESPRFNHPMHLKTDSVVLLLQIFVTGSSRPLPPPTHTHSHTTLKSSTDVLAVQAQLDCY